MAESLRRLVNSNIFSLLQDKIVRWNSTYLLNTCDDNVSRCCEILELTSRTQSQLFALLNLTASEGGTYAGCDAIKTHLLPWLGTGTFSASGGISTNTSLKILAEASDKDRQMQLLKSEYEAHLSDLEHDLNKSRNESQELHLALEESRFKIESERNKSVDEVIASEEDGRRLRDRLLITPMSVIKLKKLQDVEEELRRYKMRVGVLDEYDDQVQHLRDELLALKEEKALLTGRMDYISTLPPAVSSKMSGNSDVVQRVRQANLVTRFSHMFTEERMDAMDILRNHCEDHEMNQRIIMACVKESFRCAKLAFQQYRSKVRSTLQLTHDGLETLDEAVQNYINRNGQLLDVHSIIQDVLSALNHHPTIAYPPVVDFKILITFIRELVKTAWNMAALPSPLDISVCREAELFDELKYRRSFDSEYSAPLVNHYVWPALLDSNGKVLLKGEAVTRRGASLGSPRRSRSPSRTLSRSRSRSPSPTRRSNGVVSPSLTGSYLS